MKRHILLIAALAALVTVSCTKSGLENPEEMGRIKVSASIADGATTKGIADNTTSLRQLAFVHAQLAAPVSPVPFAGNPFGGTREAGELSEIVFESGKAPMYDRAGGKISYLMGYSPKVAPVGGVVTWTPDGATDVLVSDPWNAGTYFAPKEAAMILNHQLSRVEVALQSDAVNKLAAARDTWGKITKIAVKDAITTLSLNYATNAVTVGTAKADFPLINSNYTIGTTPDPAFTPVEIVSPPTSVGIFNISAAAMLVPTEGATTFTLVISSEKQPDAEVVATLTAPQTLTKGKLYRVTLTCDAAEKAIKATTTINAWADGGTVGSNAPILPPTIIEYGKGLGAITTGLKGSTTDSYNHLYGATDATNGPNRATIDQIYTNEKPYVMFEVAKDNLKNLNSALGNNLFERSDVLGTTLGSNLCTKNYGAGWRLPRASELKLIMLNKDALKAVPGFNISENESDGDKLWSATALNAGELWVVKYTGELATYGQRAAVRCVREVSSVPVFIEYGKAPYEKTGTELSGSTAQSYNSWWGTVAGGNNGAYQAAYSETFAIEKPYAKFEIAKNDLPAMTWTAAQGTTLDGNICTKTYGMGWRLPRFSEQRLIFENKEALSNAPGFTSLSEAVAYWSATESDATSAIYTDFEYSDMGSSVKTDLYLVRCVREMPLWAGGTPVTLEYGKAPYGTITTDITIVTDESYNNYYGIGPLTNGSGFSVANLPGEPPYVKFEVAPKDVKGPTWTASFGTTLRGSICAQTFGFGWRMPRILELKLIALNRAELAKAQGFTPLAMIDYGSATEQTLTHAYYWSSTTASFEAADKTTINPAIRCIREVYVPRAIIEYGMPPYDQIGPYLSGSGDLSYNKFYGTVAGGTNGEYTPPQLYPYLVFEKDKPFALFEVAKTDIAPMLWADAQGTSKYSDICAQTFGFGWRMPRVAELELMRVNKDKLHKIPGFSQFSKDAYMSSTEMLDIAVHAMSMYSDFGHQGNQKKFACPIRCVRELPLTTIRPVILQCGEYPYNKIEEIIVTTTKSYNGYYGDVAGTHNGAAYSTVELAIAGEPPYYKFEIAREDVGIGAASLHLWMDAHGAAPNGGLCATTYGPGWRLPRASEWQLIFNNISELNRTDGFQSFKDQVSADAYWTGTEGASTRVYAIILSSGRILAQPNNRKYRVRCIREIP